jgi:hypothetical protein
MEYIVPKEDNMGYLGRYPRGIMIDKWPHSLEAIIVRRITRRFHLLEGSFTRKFLGGYIEIYKEIETL